MAALNQPRDVFVQANDGYDGCWVCRHLGIKMAGKLQRDHWHNGPLKGQPRGILCPFHNRSLGPRYTPELVLALGRYLTRPEGADSAVVGLNRDAA